SQRDRAESGGRGIFYLPGTDVQRAGSDQRVLWTGTVPRGGGTDGFLPGKLSDFRKDSGGRRRLFHTVRQQVQPGAVGGQQGTDYHHKAAAGTGKYHSISGGESLL